MPPAASARLSIPTLALALQGADGCPSVSALSPDTGPISGAGAITIFGGGFGNATSVTFGAAGTGRIVAQSATSDHRRPAQRPFRPVRRRHRDELAGCLGPVRRRPLRLRRQPQLRPGLPLRRLRRRHLQLRRRRLLRQRGRPAVERAGGGHGRHAEFERLLARRHRRRHLHLRRRAVLRLHGRASPQQADRGHGGHARRRRLLARRRPTAASSPTATRSSTAPPAASPSTSRSWAWRPRPTATGTGSSRPTAASSPTATRSSTARQGASI